MYTQNNVEILKIGGTATVTTGNYANALNNGEIGIFTPEGVRMTEATAATETRFMVASKNSAGVIFTSPVYAKAGITSHSRLVYAAQTNQVDFIGYNGTSGSIQAINSNQYMINIQVQELLTSNTDGRKVKFGIYQADSSATQAEIAIGLAGSLINNFDREPEKFMTFESICNDAGAIIPTGAGTVAVVNGSNTITFGTAVDDATGATLLLVNEFLRFGTSTADDVYKIISIDVPTETIVLDRKYQGPTAAALANNTIERITVALGAAADWGVSMSGAALEFETGKLNAEVVRWETQLVDFGTTTENFNSTVAYNGNGTVNQIGQLEWFMSGNEGEYFREGFSYIHSSRSNVDSAVTGGGYDVIRLSITNSDTVGFQDQKSPQVLSFATPATTPNYALNATADDITDILEVLAVGSADGSLSLG